MELQPRNGSFNTKTPSIEEPCCRQATHLPGGRGEAVDEDMVGGWYSECEPVWDKK